jgi:hypothetical protein
MNKKITKNINIIGYYNHGNIGDEQYKLSFESLFLKLFNNSEISYNLNFYDCDKINTVSFDVKDIIILGGGDVLNDYFLDKIISKFQGTNNKILAVSVGMPFPSVLTDTNKLNIIDYIFLRTKQDIHLFEKYFYPHRIMYLPDISLELILNVPKPLENKIEQTTNKNKFNLVYNNLKELKNEKKKIVCLSLNRHICKSKNYDAILDNIAQFVKFLTNFDYHIVFIPFSNNFNNPNQNDILIHNDIIEKYKKIMWCSDRHKTHLINVNFNVTVDQILLLFNFVDICVPMRFHACLFSIYKNIPFFPIFTTRKIRNLLLDIDWMYGYELDTDQDFLPITLNLKILTNRFMTLLSSISNMNCNKQTLYEKLEYINLNIFGKTYNNSYQKLNDIILNNSNNQNTNSLIDEKINHIYDSVQDFAKSHNYDDFRKIKSNNFIR